MVSGGPAALAATVVGVNKGATRIILRLNKKEFSKIDTQDQLLMVVGKEGRYVIGLVRKLDPIKSNALVFLEEPQAWIKKKMKVQFKEGLWNSAFDVPMLTAPQYIQYEHSRLEAFFGGHLRQIDFKTKTTLAPVPETIADVVGDPPDPDPEKGSIGADGSRFSAEGYFQFLPQELGIKARFDKYLDVQKVDFVNSDSSDSKVVTSAFGLTGEIWHQTTEKFAFGLGMENLNISRVISAGTTEVEYGTGLFLPIASVRYDGDRSETLFWFKKGDRLQVQAAVRSDSQTSNEIDVVEIIHDEMMLQYRDLSSVSDVWGLGLGWIFWNRDNGSDFLEPKADLYELLTFRLFFESRLQSGTKLSTTISMLGSKTLNEAKDERLLNTLSVDFFYKMPLAEEFSWGFYFGAEGGVDTVVEEGDLPNTTINEEKTETQYSGLFARIAVFVSMDLDASKLP
jgi:hypothetical protein